MVIFERTQSTVAYAIYGTAERGTGEKFVFLKQFFVLREHRRQGFGREAIRLLLTEILPPDTLISLDVLIHNRAGLEFWKSIGFQEISVTLAKQPGRRVDY